MNRDEAAIEMIRGRKCRDSSCKAGDYYVFANGRFEQYFADGSFCGTTLPCGSDWRLYEEPRPEPDHEIWPVKANGAFLEVYRVGEWAEPEYRLEEILCLVNWTGRYQFTLKSGRKVLVASPRIWQCDNGTEDSWMTEPGHSFMHRRIQSCCHLLLPDGVEMVKEKKCT